MTTPTTLDDILKQAWADHADKTADVADRLEAAVGLVTEGEAASPYMHLVIHAVGDHLGERERAAKLCETVVKALGEEPGAPPLIYLAVARRLAGDDEGAIAAQDKAGEDPAIGVRIGMLVAQGLMHGGDWDGAGALYRAQLATGDILDPGHSAERACAVVSNNVASELLQLDERSDAQTKLMVEAAGHAFRYWQRIGNWVNEERGHYLLASVNNAADDNTAGREHAERGLQIISDADGEQPVDEAFLHLARAAACRDLDMADEQATSIAKAEALAANFEGDGLGTWFQDELAKSR